MSKKNYVIAPDEQEIVGLTQYSILGSVWLFMKEHYEFILGLIIGSVFSVAVVL